MRFLLWLGAYGTAIFAAWISGIDTLIYAEKKETGWMVFFMIGTVVAIGLAWYLSPNKKNKKGKDE